jgi:hypothetical protein
MDLMISNQFIFGRVKSFWAELLHKGQRIERGNVNG